MKTQPSPVKITRFNSVPLQNDGSLLEVYVVGHGAALSQTNTSFIAIVGGVSLLIDCGYHVPASLARFGINPAWISDFFITHAHSDHVGGIAYPLVSNRYTRSPLSNTKSTLWAPRTWAEALWNDTLSGDLSSHDSSQVLKDEGGEDLKALPSNRWYDILLPKEATTFAGREIYRFEKGGLKLEAFRTMHTPAKASSWQESAWSTGVLINDSIWISGDTRFDKALIESYAPRSKVMIHDVSRYSQDPVHASFDSLNNLRVDSGKSKMFLSHLQNGFDDTETEKMAKTKGFWGLALTGTKFSVVL